FHLIHAVGKRQCAIDRNSIVVEQDNQLVEFEMARERDGFLTDAFHQVAVRSNDICLVIDHALAEHSSEMLFSDRHADCVSETLPEWAGRRFNAGYVAKFRMAGGDRAELAE